MPRKATTMLIVLLVFGSASVVFADTPGSTMSDDRIGAVNDAAKLFVDKEKASFDGSQPAAVQSAPFRRGGIAGGTMAWIKLTEPGGKLIHINVEQVTSVRSGTQIPGARAQLDLASGKFQGVQENAEHVMRLISAASSARDNDETASAVELR